MKENKIKIESLPDIKSESVDLWNIQWMAEQSKALSNMPSDSFNYWDKEDDDNIELDYGPDKYNGITHPNLEHLKLDSEGKIKIESLPDI